MIKHIFMQETVWCVLIRTVSKNPVGGQGQCPGIRTRWYQHCQVGLALFTVTCACPKAINLSQHRGSLTVAMHTWWFFPLKPARFFQARSHDFKSKCLFLKNQNYPPRHYYPLGESHISEKRSADSSSHSKVFESVTALPASFPRAH